MTHALTTTGGGGDLNLPALRELGDLLVKSRFFKDATDQAAAVTKVLLGRELGIEPMAAMLGIHVIQGKPVLGSHLIASGIKKSGKYDYRVLEKTPERCRIAFVSLNADGSVKDTLGTEEFTLEEARTGGMLGRNPTWKTAPKAMLFARAIGNGYRTYCPDALAVLAYAEGEIDDEPVTVQARVVSTETNAPRGARPRLPSQTQEIRRPGPEPTTGPIPLGTRVWHKKGSEHGESWSVVGYTSDGNARLSGPGPCRGMVTVTVAELVEDYAATGPTPASPTATSSPSVGLTSSSPPTAPAGESPATLAAASAAHASASSGPASSGASGATSGSGNPLADAARAEGPSQASPAGSSPAGSPSSPTTPTPTGERKRAKPRRDA